MTRRLKRAVSQSVYPDEYTGIALTDSELILGYLTCIPRTHNSDNFNRVIM